MSLATANDRKTTVADEWDYKPAKLADDEWEYHPAKKQEVQFQSPTTGVIQAVPPEHWDEALSAGYKPTSHKVMYSPNGERGMVANGDMADFTRQGYTTILKTQFEKDRPGHGMTLEGAGSAAWEKLKSLVPESPQSSPFSKEFWSGKPGDWRIDPEHSGIAEAIREARFGREHPFTEIGMGPTSSAITSGLGSLVGVSGRHMSELAERGEGGQILGEAAVPATMAAAPVATNSCIP